MLLLLLQLQQLRAHRRRRRRADLALARRTGAYFVDALAGAYFVGGAKGCSSRSLTVAAAVDGVCCRRFVWVMGLQLGSVLQHDKPPFQ